MWKKNEFKERRRKKRMSVEFGPTDDPQTLSDRCRVMKSSASGSNEWTADPTAHPGGEKRI